MATTESEPMVAELAKELKEISAEWSAIRTTYQEDDPDKAILDDDQLFLEATTIDLCCSNWPREELTDYLTGRKYRQNFPEAFNAAKRRAEDVMCHRLAPWANRVIRLFCISRFPREFRIPDLHLRRREISESLLHARLLTDTDDMVEAGKRIILWSATFPDPTAYQVEDGYRHLYLEWTRYLVTFGCHHCRTISAVMECITAAFEALCRDATPDEPRVDPIATTLIAQTTTDPKPIEEKAAENPLSVERPLGFTPAKSDVVADETATIPLDLLEQIPGNEETMKTLAILSLDTTVDEKLRALGALDKRYFGFTSLKLSELLGVSR